MGCFCCKFKKQPNLMSVAPHTPDPQTINSKGSKLLTAWDSANPISTEQEKGSSL